MGEPTEVKGEVAPVPSVMGTAKPTFTPVMGAPPPMPTTVHREPKNLPPKMGKPTIGERAR
jgi:hypothetical protein